MIDDHCPWGHSLHRRWLSVSYPLFHGSLVCRRSCREEEKRKGSIVSRLFMGSYDSGSYDSGTACKVLASNSESNVTLLSTSYIQCVPCCEPAQPNRTLIMSRCEVVKGRLQVE